MIFTSSIEFVKETLSKTSKYDSKKITAMVFSILVCMIVISFLTIVFLAIWRNIIITDGVYRVLDLLTNNVLIYLLGAIALLFGVHGWEKLGLAKSGMTTNTTSETTEKTETITNNETIK